MPAIVPPGDELAIGHEFPDCEQDHQYGDTILLTVANSGS